MLKGIKSGLNLKIQVKIVLVFVIIFQVKVEFLIDSKLIAGVNANCS